MRAPTLDELVLSPEPLAVQRHFDARNYRVFRWLMVLVFFLSLGGIGASAELHESFGLAMYILDAAAGVALFVLRGRDLFVRNFRQILLIYLFCQLLVLKYATYHLRDGEHVPFMLVCFLLLAFRLRASEHLMLFAAFWVTAVFPLGWLGAPRAAPIDQEDSIVAVSILAVVCLLTAVGVTHLDRKRFLAVWRKEHARHRERLRMREEIDYARKIQLSMLPQVPPQLAWIDLAAASLPATEVGGDYYEYFKLDEDKLALVIGDVAGHGLASGLLLSGVRSCLYLLEEYLAVPERVFDRLNRMVRRTTDKRTYMTLLCAVLDRAAGTMSLVSAGHPPVLHWNARTCRFEEVGEGAPPLGTFLEARYEPVQRPVAPGDLLIFYTDGLVEARNEHGLEYGDARLQKAVDRAAASRTAREIRDAVLGDLANFKGDQEQADDMTLVVVRLR
ncbi:MAG: PP2C family protein-serine/threonine phosphatase [Thermoanaerobaculia bacterium]